MRLAARARRCAIRASVVAAALAALSPGAVGFAAPIIRMPGRSVSLSQQFVVYCDDVGLRLEVCGFAEEVKRVVLSALDSGDQWKHPIVVTLLKPATVDVGVAPSRVAIVQVEEGLKIEVNVALAGDLAETRFPQQLVKAILLELAYRGGLPPHGEYTEPRPWLVEGLTAMIPTRRATFTADVFKTMIEANRFPSLADFLALSGPGTDSTSQAMYRACALSLVELLADIEGGRKSLLRYLRNLPNHGGDDVAELARYFPALAVSEQAREKWWSLGVAKLAASDRYRGEGFAETGARLDALLTWTLPRGDDVAPKIYTLDDHREILRSKELRGLLDASSNDIMALETRAHPLMRPVVTGYREIVADLAKGSGKGIEKRLSDLSGLRDALGKRLGAIGDYLNWFEATQPSEWSGTFDAYLKAARQPADLDTRCPGPIADYLDIVEKEME